MSDIKVFISSTMDELRNERFAVWQSIMWLEKSGLDIQPFMFERDASANPSGVHQTWRETLKESSIYIGLFYKQYGEYTVEEFSLAYRVHRIPCFVYVCDYHASPVSDIVRDPRLQAFLNEINRSSVTVGRFTYAEELKRIVVRDLIRWLFAEGQRASRQLARVQNDLRAARAEIARMAKEIAKLQSQLAVAIASASATKQDLERQISELEKRERAARQEIAQLKEVAKQLRSVVEKRTAQTTKFQQRISEYATSPQEFVTKEQVAEEMRRILEGQLGAQVTLSQAPQYVDLEARIDVALTAPYTVLLRVIEAPITFRDIEFMEARIARVAAAHGLLLGTSRQLREPLFDLYHGERLNVFLIDVTPGEVEGQLLTGMGLLEIYALIQLGDERYATGDFAGAIPWYQSAASKASADGYTDLELTAWVRVANTWRWVPDIKQTLESATVTLAKARQAAHSLYETEAALCFLQGVALVDLRNRWGEMGPLLRAGIKSARTARDYTLQAAHLVFMGECNCKLREIETAYACLQDALNIMPARGQLATEYQYRVYRTLSEIFCMRGDNQEARRYGELALGIAQANGRSYFAADARLVLARVEQARGEMAEALRLVEEVLPQARQMSWKGIEQEAEYRRGELERELGHLEKAQAAARRALELAQEMHAREAEVQALLSLGQTLAALGEQDNARHTLSLARRLSQERNYEDYFHRAEVLLQALADRGAQV